MKFETLHTVATIAASERLSQQSVFDVTITDAPSWIHPRMERTSGSFLDRCTFKILGVHDYKDVVAGQNGRQAHMRLRCGLRITGYAHLC